MTHASVFSGIGGPEVAAAMLGWENLFHCEINPFGRKVLQYWFPNSESYEDVTKTDFSKWRGKVDVLSGGFPCQPFSYAGKRRGTQDDRFLWPHMLRVIQEVRPTWVIGENVNGIRTDVEPGVPVEVGSEADLFGESDRVYGYRQESTFTIEQICRNFESVGYSVQPFVIPACSVEAPHRRDRSFFIAHTNRCADMREAREDESESGEERLQERDEVREFNQSDNVRRAAANTDSQLLPRWDYQAEKRRIGQELGAKTLGKRMVRDAKILRGLLREERWADFPTVSPVHRGNDGLPFDVDRLTIPFSEWRTESIKAYGNAIVPQVMYEIFRIINLIEK